MRWVRAQAGVKSSGPRVNTAPTRRARCAAAPQSQRSLGPMLPLLAASLASIAPAVELVHRGLDQAAADAAFADLPDHVMLDHLQDDISVYSNMSAYRGRCQQALKRAIWEEQHDLPPYLYSDALEGVQLGERDRATDPRIVYFIGATRPSADIMVSRLILALYHVSHLFLVHIDLKAEGVYETIDRVTNQHPNIHLTATRRLVQWGAWTMVLPLLDAIKTVTDRNVDFDFVINLSDVDIALRTNDEIVRFLRPYRGRNLLQAACPRPNRLARSPPTISRTRRGRARPTAAACRRRCTWARASICSRRATSPTRTSSSSAAATATSRSTRASWTSAAASASAASAAAGRSCTPAPRSCTSPTLAPCRTRRRSPTRRAARR